MSKAAASQVTVSLNGAPLFSLEDIYQVDASILVIQALEPPAETQEIPPDSPGMQGLKPTALADHVRKSQADVSGWDPLKKDMSVLASDLNSFCGDSLVALDELVQASKKIETKFDKMSDAEKEGLQKDMASMFQDLYDKTVSSEDRAQLMADQLGKFATLLRDDSTGTEKIRSHYQDYITKREKEVRAFETEKGLPASDDLVAELTKRVKALNEEIQEKEKAWIASTSVASAMGAASLNPLFWIFSIPGVIAASVAAGVMKNQWNEKLEEIKPFVEQLAKAEKLNTLKIWFEHQGNTMATLIEQLELATVHVSNLRGQWQTLRNELGQLTGASGKLMTLPKTAWLEPISTFRERTIRSVYEKMQGQTELFQKFAFSTPNVKKRESLHVVK